MWTAVTRGIVSYACRPPCPAALAHACSHSQSRPSASARAHAASRASSSRSPTRSYEGAKIFQQSCSGCHTIEAAGTEGSATDPNGREYVDGPNFEARKEDVDQVLYAIRNGGFSSGPMPQDIVVGERAQKVAEFVAEYSGGDAAGG